MQTSNLYKFTFTKLAIIFGIVVMFAGGNASPASGDNPVTISVDLTKPQGLFKPIYSWFGYDESNYTMMKFGKALLA